MSPGAASLQPPSRRGSGAARRRCLEAGQLVAHVVVDRLVDQPEHRVQAVLAAVERGRQSPVGADAADGEQRAYAATLGLRDDPLQLADLVAAPGAVPEDALVLQPHLAAAHQPASTRRTGVGVVPSRRWPRLRPRGSGRAAAPWPHPARHPTRRLTRSGRPPARGARSGHGAAGGRARSREVRSSRIRRRASSGSSCITQHRTNGTMRSGYPSCRGRLERRRSPACSGCAGASAAPGPPRGRGARGGSRGPQRSGSRGRCGGRCTGASHISPNACAHRRQGGVDDAVLGLHVLEHGQVLGPLPLPRRRGDAAPATGPRPRRCGGGAAPRPSGPSAAAGRPTPPPRRPGCARPRRRSASRSRRKPWCMTYMPVWSWGPSAVWLWPRELLSWVVGPPCGAV